MQKILYLEILGSVSDKGFSLDELVLKTKELFEREGMPGFVSLILSLVDEQLCIDLMRGESRFSHAPCCERPRYEAHDRRDRSFRTSVGDVELRWRRVRCKNCGRGFIPLREFLGVDAYQSKSNELERVVTEVVSEQSYRRSSDHLLRIGEIPVPKSTLHRWVAQSDCDELVWPRGLRFLLADGSGYKRRPDPERELNNRGEVRVALGVNNRGATVALGAWSGKSWEEIGADLNRSRGRRAKAGLLVSDGEAGLAEGLSDLANGHQRCHWHMARDLNHTLWEDESPKPERDAYGGRLRGILGLELPVDCVEPVREDDKSLISARIKEAERQLDKLAGEFFLKGYVKASGYVNRARKNLFANLRLWLKCGIIGPRASSLIERMMREIGRRLKRIAFGWSEQGAAKMARIVIKRFSSAKQWDAYWLKKLRIEDKVMLVYRGAHVK